MLGEAGEAFHLPCKELLLVGRERVPVLDSLGFRRELGVRRDDAELLLARERFLAILVPAAVEFALVLVGPLLRHVVRRVGGARSVIQEERFVRREGVLSA